VLVCALGKKSKGGFTSSITGGSLREKPREQTGPLLSGDQTERTCPTKPAPGEHKVNPRAAFILVHGLRVTGGLALENFD